MKKLIVGAVTALSLCPAAAMATCEFFTDWDYGGDALVLQKGECVIFDQGEAGSEGMCSNRTLTNTLPNFNLQISSFRLSDGAAAGLKWYVNGGPVVEVNPFGIAQMTERNDLIVAVSCD